jgi:hypothetical protein
MKKDEFYMHKGTKDIALITSVILYYDLRNQNFVYCKMILPPKVHRSSIFDDDWDQWELIEL